MSFAEIAEASARQYSRDEIKRILTDKLYRLNTIYYIRNKDGRIVQFKMNEAQLNFYNNRHNRNIQLKARQLGFSTLAVIDALDDCLLNDFFEAGIIAYSLDDAEKLMKKAKLAFAMLPSWLRKYRMPETDKASEMRFPNGSVFSVDTSFRGGTLSRLHVSELAKIAKKNPEKAKEIITGAFEAVPLNGIIDVESTAEGMTGEYYQLCQEAMPKDPASLTELEFKFHFDPWWKNPEYKISADIGSKDFNEYFTYLETDHGITLSKDQKSWYVLKAGTLKDEMHQEYPSYPEEAFMASGRPYFDNQEIAKDIRLAKKRPFKTKTFQVTYQDKDGKELAKSYPVKIFHEPNERMAYAIGGDPAEGLASGDNSALSVVSKEFEQMAAFAGKVDPDLFGGLLVEVAKYYNEALIAPEVNNHGHAVLASIKTRKYYNIFTRRAKEQIAEEPSDKIGWHNNVKSKMEMLDEFKQAYRDEVLAIHDEETLREMMTVVIEEDGNVIVNGKDRVVCHGIAIQGLKQAIMPGTAGTFESGSGKPKFKGLHDMLKWQEQNRNEESYFD